MEHPFRCTSPPYQAGPQAAQAKNTICLGTVPIWGMVSPQVYVNSKMFNSPLRPPSLAPFLPNSQPIPVEPAKTLYCPFCSSSVFSNTVRCAVLMLWVVLACYGAIQILSSLKKKNLILAPSKTLGTVGQVIYCGEHTGPFRPESYCTNQSNHL